MRAYRRIAAVLALGLLLLVANLSWLQVLGADGIRRHGDNTRLLLEQYNRARGPIIIGADQVATSSRATADGFYQRSYTDGPLYSTVTGYYSLLYGSSGIEYTENDVLAGTDSRFFVDRIQQLFAGRHQAGGAVTLTIDGEAQRAAFAALGDERGAVVAIDARTGAILAMMSTPAFDPQVLAPNDPESVRAAYEELANDPAQPMVNRAVARAHPLGRMLQVVTAAAALASGDYALDTRIPSPGTFRIGDTTVRNPSACVRAEVSLATALRLHCSTAFAWLGQRLGHEALQGTAEQFGFNDAFAVVSPSVASRLPIATDPGLIASGASDARATVLQMALVAAALAEDGTIMMPHLVADVRAPNLAVVDQASPSIHDTPLSQRAAQALLSAIPTGKVTGSRLLSVSDEHAWAIGMVGHYAVAVGLERATADAAGVASSVLSVMTAKT